MTAIDGTPITYDAIGNPLNDGTWTYTWQNGRQLASMSKSGTTASFKYNENGLRVQKTVNGVTTDYTLHGKNIVHMKQGSNNLHFFYDAQNCPAVVVYNGTAYSYTKNLQGDIVAILNSAGTVVVSYVYDAWGRPISCTGTMAATLGKLNPFRYRGYVYDEETKLYYLRSRYFCSAASRFINADSILGKKNVLYSHNIFSYCRCNPVGYADPSGHVWRLVLLGLLSLLLSGCGNTEEHDNTAEYNCYAYAVGRTTWMNPGGDERQRKYFDKDKLFKIKKDYFDVSDTAQAVIDDLGGDEYAQIVEEGMAAEVPEGWHMIALRTGYSADAEGYVTISPNRIDGDYHFMRLDNGVWTHKPGGTAIRELPEGITPESEGAWDPMYTSEILYMIVRDDW